MRRGLTLTAFDIDDLIDKSDHQLFLQATQPGHCLHHLLPPRTSTYTVLISFVRGNIHTCFSLFNICGLKTLISIIVYLNMYNPLVILCFLSVHISRFIFCVLYFVYFVYFIDIPPCNSVRLSY